MTNRLEEFLGRANRFVSPRTGLIRQVYELCVEPDDALVHFAATEVAITSRYGLSVDCFDHNGGAGLTGKEAVAAALGETIERYAGSVYFPQNHPLAPYRDLKERAVHPTLLTPYSPAQYAQPGFPFEPFTESSPVSWVRGFSLVDHEPIWYPASLVFVPYHVQPAEVAIAPSVSTGMALAMTPAEAILSGLCEVVERDAVMIMWWNRLPVPEIVVPADSWLSPIIAKHFTVPGVTFRLFDITTDARIPTVFCVAAEEHTGGCAIACGAAARPDPVQAALKALIEAAQTRAWVRSLTRQHGTLEAGPAFERITNFENHVHLYGQPHMRDAVAFLIRQQPSVSLSELPGLKVDTAEMTLRRCVEALLVLDLEPIVVNLTPADVAQQDLCVVKVAIPSMVELNADHNLRFLGFRRLYEAPVRLGYRSTAATATELNPFPHPFP